MLPLNIVQSPDSSQIPGELDAELDIVRVEYNAVRLHSYLDDIPPAEFEAALHADPRTDQGTVIPEGTGCVNRVVDQWFCWFSASG